MSILAPSTVSLVAASVSPTGGNGLVKGSDPQLPLRHGTEYVRNGGPISSWRNLFEGVRHGCQLVANQVVHMTISAGLIGTTSYLGYSHEPPALIAVPAFSTWALGATLFFLGLHGRIKGKEDDGIFSICKTIAGHAYSVTNPQTNKIKEVSPLDPVLELHVDDRELASRMEDVPTGEIPDRFSEMLNEELAEMIARLPALLKESNSKVVRLWTTLNPKYFEGLEQFEINEVRLSKQTPAKPSWLSRLSARFIKRSAELRFIQIYTNIFFRPVRRWLKTYPVRTYLIFEEDLDQLTSLPALKSSSS